MFVHTGSSQEECTHGPCLSLNENTQIFTQDKSDNNDVRHPIDVSVYEEKDLSKDIINEGLQVQDFQTFDQDIKKQRDFTDIEIKETWFQLNYGIFSKELQNGEGFK